MTGILSLCLDTDEYAYLQSLAEVYPGARA